MEQSEMIVERKEPGGLSLAALENLLSDLQYQPEWRKEADICGDYYDAHQLKAERLATMERLGIPPLVTNLIGPVIDSVLGMEAKTRTDWRVIEADEASEVPEEILLALNAKLNEAERMSRADRAISDAYASFIKAGVGWVEVSRAVDAMAYRYKVDFVHRNEMWWDWRAKQPDLSDGRYLVRKRRFDHDILIAMMPEHEKLIRWTTADRFKSWQYETMDRLNDPDLAYAAHLERTTNIDENEWRDADRKRATLFEVWYRTWQRGYVSTLPNGKVIPFNKQNPEHVAAVQQGLISPPELRVYSSLRVAFYLGPHRLYDFPTPYPHNHFPYVPFFGYKEDNSGIRYGMIRRMISPQDVVNSADAKMHALLNAKRIEADSDAIDTRYNTWKQVVDQVSSPNAVVFLDPQKPNRRFKVFTDFQLSAQQFSRRQQASQDIEKAAGIYKAALGDKGNSTSGVMTDSLVEQSNIMMAELNDNHAFGRRLVGEILFSLVHEDIKGVQMDVAYKKNGKRQLVTLNKKTADESGKEIIENDISNIGVKVTLEDIPSTPSFKSQQLKVLSEVVKSLPPQMQALAVPAMIMLTDVPEKDDLAESIRKLAGIKPKLTDEQQEEADKQAEEAQKIAADLERRISEANVKLLEEKVNQLEKQNKKIDAERLVKMVEAMYSALQSGQLVATIPQIAPVADEILKGAGYEEAEVPEVSGTVQQPAAEVPAMGQEQPQSPLVGGQQGIETMANDGVR
jgi:hypothetical protein